MPQFSHLAVDHTNIYQYVLEIKFPFSAAIMETTAEPSVATSVPPITLLPSVTSWSLDLDVGGLTLEVNNSEGLIVSTANCSAFQIVWVGYGCYKSRWD